MTGSSPKNQIDHINGDPSDNRWVNLRDVDNRTNNQNKRKAQSNNKLGILGVNKHRGSYRARIKMENGTSICLGVYCTSQEAEEAYMKAKLTFHKGYVL